MMIVVASPPVSPFFIGLVLIVVMPFVPAVMTLVDEPLTLRIAAEMIILSPMFFIVQIGLRLIHHYFAAMVQIEMRISRRKLARKDPVSSAIQIYK